MLSAHSYEKSASEDASAAMVSDGELHPQINTLLRWGPLLAAALYLILAMILGLGSVGLQYDEALQQHGAVHMLNPTNNPGFSYVKGQWIYWSGRYWPLAIVPYVGAVKDYILLLPFALFGTGPEVARGTNAMLGALGIWGIATLIRNELSVRIATAVAFVIAIHPAYLAQTVYDNGVVVVWMAILGLLSLTVAHYKKRPSALAATCVGLAMGVGVWNRANFLWLIASAFVSIAIVFGGKLLIPVRHIAALVVGGLVGVSPFILFQIISKWSILRFLNGAQVPDSVITLLSPRLQMISEVLISDAEQRTIWNGPPLPLWQSRFFSVILILSLCACFAPNPTGSKNVIAWRRASALTMITFALIMLCSKLSIAYHHLISLVPLAAIVVVLAFHEVSTRWKKARIVAIAVAVVYVASATYWNLAAARGVRETGGVNMWSDGINALKDKLILDYEGREVEILDWGLQNNLYVLSNGKIASEELFWGANEKQAGSGDSWSELIARGGVYLTNSGENMHFPTATWGFLAALTASGQPYKLIEFHQKQGRPYAELYEISPLDQSVDSTQSIGSNVRATGTLTANPNPIVVCENSRGGATTIYWTSSGATKVEVRVGAPDGSLFASASQAGSWATGEWVTSRTVFYLQDVSDGRPLTRRNTLATVTVDVTNAGCP